MQSLHHNREPTNTPLRWRLGKVLSIGAGLALTVLVLCGAWIWAIQPERQPGCPRWRLWFGLRDKCEFDREFSADALLVDETFFPVEVDIIPFESSPRYEIELALVDVSPVDCQLHPSNCDCSFLYARHEISRYTSDEVASSWYLGALSGAFPYSYGPHFVPDDLDYQSPVAEHFRVACRDKYYEVCHAVGKYQDYVSVFEARISPSCMAYSDFHDILVRIDERMAQYLEIDD